MARENDPDRAQNLHEDLERRLTGTAKPCQRRWCRRCKKWKEASGFSNDRRRGDGKDIYCRMCRRDMIRTAQVRNPNYHSRYYKKRKLELAYARQLLLLLERTDPEHKLGRPTPPLHLPVETWLKKPKLV